MKPLYFEKGRALIKVEKTFTKEKYFDEEAKKFKTRENVTYGNTGEIISGTDSSFKKGDKVLFNFYGTLQVKEDKKASIVVCDYEDITVKL